MKARANTDNKFLYKYLLIGIATLLYSGYCYYDAFYNYPIFKMPVSEAYDALNADIERRKETDPDDTNWGQIRDTEWAAITTEKNWPTTIPRNSAEDVKHNINFSIGLGLLCTAIGIPCIVWFLRTNGTWIEIDGSKIADSNGTQFDISSVHLLDKKKWVKKGIAVAHYKDEAGSEQTFVLDDLKYERTVVDGIVAELEKTLTADQIVNGPTEAELASQLEAAQQARQKRLEELEGDDPADA